MSSYVSLAPFYDGLMPEEDYLLWADCCEQLFRPRGIHTVLDLACGTGTLSWLLADRGFEVIGVDLSCDMLAAAMEKAQAHPGVTAPLFLNQALGELDLYGTVQAAVCSMDSVNYLDEPELVEALRRLRLFLEPGGILLLDFNTPEKFRRMDGETFVSESEDAFCVWRAETEEDEGICTYWMDVFFREGDLWRREEEEHTEYIYSPEKLQALLTAAGFPEPKLYAGLPLRPAQGGEERLFCLCGAEA